MLCTSGLNITDDVMFSYHGIYRQTGSMALCISSLVAAGRAQANVGRLTCKLASSLVAAKMATNMWRCLCHGCSVNSGCLSAYVNSQRFWLSKLLLCGCHVAACVHEFAIRTHTHLP